MGHAGQQLDKAIPVAANLTLAAALWSVGVFVYYVLPLALLPRSPLFALLLIPALLTTTTNWSLIHEAIHSHFHPRSSINDGFGRVSGILFGAPFETFKFAHLLHHALNGTLDDRPEYYDASTRSRRKAAFIFYWNLLFGLYAIEVVGAFACLLPRFVLVKLVRLFPREGTDARAARYLLEPARLWAIRLDSALAIGCMALAFWCYGRYWPLLALAIVARGVLISFVDNGYHYRAPLGQAERSAYNLDFPFGAAILNFNLHQTHHRHPNLPWSALPAAFARDGDTHDGPYFRAMLRQFRGPIDYAAK